MFFVHEDWQPDVDDPRVTGYTRLFALFQRQTLTSILRLLGDPNREDLRSKNAVERAQHSFAWTTLAWLDTLHFLASKPQVDQDKLAEVSVQQRNLDLSLSVSFITILSKARDDVIGFQIVERAS